MFKKLKSFTDHAIKAIQRDFEDTKDIFQETSHKLEDEFKNMSIPLVDKLTDTNNIIQSNLKTQVTHTIKTISNIFNINADESAKPNDWDNLDGWEDLNVDANQDWDKDYAESKNIPGAAQQLIKDVQESSEKLVQGLKSVGDDIAQELKQSTKSDFKEYKDWIENAEERIRDWEEKTIGSIGVLPWEEEDN